MDVRDATLDDTGKNVEIYNGTVQSHTATADTEPVSVEDRLSWFHEHVPASRPSWVANVDGEVGSWLSLGDFYDGRPAYHATAEIAIYINEGNRRLGVGRRWLIEEAIQRGPALGLDNLTAGAFAHKRPSIALFEGYGFASLVCSPRVAKLDRVGRDHVFLGLRIDEPRGLD